MHSPTLLAKPVKVAIAAAAILFVYSNVLAKLARDWWADENYSHGLLIPFIISYILWGERKSLVEAEQHPHTVLGGVGIVFALLALWAGVTGAELFVQRVSLVLLLASVVIYFWGFQLLRLLLVPLLLLLLAIPVPAIIFNQIAFPLQLFASRCAVWAMELVGIPVLREGNVIELLPRGALVTQKLEVVEACSGIRSLMTLVTLAVVFAYFTYPKENGRARGLARLRTYGFWRSLVIVASAVPIAIITNAARVSGMGILSYRYGTDVAEGFFHSFSGWVTYVIALATLFVFGWMLDKAARLMHLKSTSGRGEGMSELSVPRWSVESVDRESGKMKEVRYWGLIIVLVLSGVGIHAWERIGEAQIKRLPLSEFPSEIGNWRQYGPDERFDEATESVLRASDYLSRLYISNEGYLASLYIGYYATQRTGVTYHSPLNCLPGAGWEMTEPARVTIRPEGAPPFEANRYIIQKGRDKQLLIYWYQGRGRALASEYWGKIYTVLDSMSRRRSDGAMVRIIIPLGPTMPEEKALALATDLAAKSYTYLPRFVPD